MSNDDGPRRQRVDAICHAALDMPGEARRVFVRETCAGDEALLRDVEDLLAHAPVIDQFLEQRIDAVAAGVMADMPAADERSGAIGGGNRAAAAGLLTGQRLCTFDIGPLLGVGGMGEVYRARDTRLGRAVAIKILPRDFKDDADRLSRFEREARVLASLNHPHIGAIYGMEDADGVIALVMELVDGEELSQRVARGAISLADALPIARQIAEALEAAHEQGIVHRDLKPANIKVRNDGTVKVLDFVAPRRRGEETVM